MAAPSRQVYRRRDTITALPLYYSGHLLKKNTEEKDFTAFYGELRGSTIFLYTDDMNDTYSEKLDLQMLKSMAMESPYTNQRPIIYTLTLSNKEVQLQVDHPDSGEEWRGFIMTVATKEIPDMLHLLPGQMLRLREVLSEEQKRQAVCPPLFPPTSHYINPSSSSPSGDIYDDIISGVPCCFFPVSRQEAEKMLKENPGYGSLIIRPSTDNVNYAISLRQDKPSGPVMKNFKVFSTDTGFVINLDDPVTVPSLAAAVDHFRKVTGFSLSPYQVPQTYDTCMDLTPALPCLPSETGPRARVAPVIRTRSPTRDTPLSIPTPPAPPIAPDTSYEYEYTDDI